MAKEKENPTPSQPATKDQVRLISKSLEGVSTYLHNLNKDNIVRTNEIRSDARGLKAEIVKKTDKLEKRIDEKTSESGKKIDKIQKDRKNGGKKLDKIEKGNEEGGKKLDKIEKGTTVFTNKVDGIVDVMGQFQDVLIDKISEIVSDMPVVRENLSIPIPQDDIRLIGGMNDKLDAFLNNIDVKLLEIATPNTAVIMGDPNAKFNEFGVLIEDKLDELFMPLEEYAIQPTDTSDNVNNLSQGDRDLFSKMDSLSVEMRSQSDLPFIMEMNDKVQTEKQDLITDIQRASRIFKQRR